MKKYLISIIILTLFILVVITPQSTLAITTDITSDEFVNEFNPLEPTGSDKDIVNNLSSPIMDAIVKIVNPILGTLQIIRGNFSSSFNSNVWPKKYHRG